MNAKSPTPKAVRRIDAIGAVASVGLLAVVWGVEIGPSRLEAAAAIERTAGVDMVEARRTALEEVAARLEAERGEFTAARRRVEHALPRRRDEAETLQSLIKIARADGVRLTRLEPRDATGDGRCESVTVAIAGRGDFAGIVTFLAELDRLPRAHRVGRVMLERDGDALRLDLDLHLLRRPVWAESEQGDGDD